MLIPPSVLRYYRQSTADQRTDKHGKTVNLLLQMGMWYSDTGSLRCYPAAVNKNKKKKKEKEKYWAKIKMEN